MDRRDFLRRGIGKVSEVAVEQADKKISARINWIRPPFALPELEFLLSCTRCDACVEACPHGVIFKLAARLGADVVGTPALDLLNKACHLCSDWPCVKSCEAGALQNDRLGSADMPQLAEISINTTLCLPYLGPECGACADACPVDGALLWQADRPQITSQCIGCALCREQCITEPKAIDIKVLAKLNNDQTG